MRIGPVLAHPSPPRSGRHEFVEFATKGGVMFEVLDPNRLAAIVYDDGVAVDALMSAFARELVEAGVAARGLVQLPPEEGGCGPRAPMRVQAVATGEIIPICQQLGPGAGSCCLDTSALAGAAAMLRRDALQPSDILFFSKFGKQEANGGGFRADPLSSSATCSLSSSTNSFASALISGSSVVAKTA